MSGYYLAGAWLLFVAFVICACAGADHLKRREDRFDADLDALRTPDMGNAAVSPDEPTPIFDQLAAERVVASAGEVVAAEWKRSEVYDVDDWPGAS